MLKVRGWIEGQAGYVVEVRDCHEREARSRRGCAPWNSHVVAKSGGFGTRALGLQDRKDDVPSVVCLCTDMRVTLVAAAADVLMRCTCAGHCSTRACVVVGNAQKDRVSVRPSDQG